ncbi:MAG: polysaccharide deacetylase family protein [Ignavibacteriae bacterium]|nr:polysaccharide deacetylase family protein [Flavobacteriaceae bacterium]MCB0750330.1 polysaccharide deacetylase family protein [Ignavibacteriota bacterium]
MNAIHTFNLEFKISVLLYHQIGISPSDETNINCFCKTTEFYNQMQFLSKSNEFEVISLASAINLVSASKCIDRNYVVLTFDDGCESFYDITYPILNSFSFPATVYPISGFLDDYLKIKGKLYKHLKIMSKSMIQELSRNGVKFGAHSVNHIKFTEVMESEIESEIKNSKNSLEQILGIPIDSFSYPHGAYNDRIIDMLISAGFSNAVTCNSGSLSNSNSLFEIPRKYITFFDDLDAFKRKLT